MSLDLYRIISGLDIQAADLSANVNILTGATVPGGDSAEQDNAPVGSLFLLNTPDSEKSQLFWKHSTAANANSDWSVAADRDFVKALIQGVSWRAPVKVMDSTVYANAAAFPVTGTVDGVALADGDRVLFSGATTGSDKNVFIWDAATSTWTEDTNEESDGDTVLVQEGTKAEEQWTHNGTEWVLIGSAQNAEEIGNLRSFMGKDGVGAEMPTYNAATPNVVANGDSLEKAIGELDKLQGDGDIINTTPNHALGDDLTSNGGALTTTDALNNLNDAIGTRTFTTPGIVTDGATSTANIDALNEEVVKLNAKDVEVKGTAPAATDTVIDTITAEEGTEVKWMLQVRDAGAPNNRRALKIHAFNNGTALDYNKSSVLVLGTNIPGLDITVVMNGTSMELRVKATGSVDFVSTRLGYTAF